MNVAQLLADLQGRSYIERVGTWDIVETKPDGTVLYSAPTFQTVGGNAASYINVQVYVYDEGGANEQAWYKDIPPDQKPRTSAFMSEIVAAVDAQVDNLKGIQVHAIEERWKMAIFTILVLDGATLVQKSYYWRSGSDMVEIVGFKPELTGSLLRV